jgi:hypothetical protein
LSSPVTVRSKVAVEYVRPGEGVEIVKLSELNAQAKGKHGEEQQHNEGL